APPQPTPSQRRDPGSVFLQAPRPSPSRLRPSLRALDLSALPEHDFARAVAVERAVRLADVGAGRVELAAPRQGISDLLVSILRVQRQEVEAPRPRVEFEQRVAEVIRPAVAARICAVVGAQREVAAAPVRGGTTDEAEQLTEARHGEEPAPALLPEVERHD